MIKKITFLAALLLSSFVYSQMRPVGHLTIFSEDGDKFRLILNGEVINDIYQTNLRVEDLNQPYYNAKIQFEDKTLTDISKNSLMIADADGNYSDVTYKIRRDKNNKSKMKLNYFSAIPADQGFVAPANMYVVHYGQPAPTSVTQTTTSTTGTSVATNVNLGGINMNVSIHEPVETTVTHTTTTTSHHSSDNYHEEAPRGCDRRYAMSPNDFNNALATVKKQGFDETRLKTAKQIASANCLNVNQIMQISNAFGFEETKLDFAKFAYDRCVEPRNYFNLNNIFSFSSSVDELTDYIQTRN